jgi:energy-coupling factor transport system ATP-binding protein
MVKFKMINLIFSSKYPIRIIGPSGSGKSTYLSNFSQQMYKEKKYSISFQQQNGTLFEENLNNYFEIFNIKKSDLFNQAIEELGLEEVFKNGRLNVEKNTSGGERSRLSFLRTLFSDADIYIFDEPTSGVHYKISLKMWKMIELHAKSKKIIFTSHDKVPINFTELKLKEHEY